MAAAPSSRLLIHAITLQKLSTSKDAAKGNVSSWATRTSSVACLISQLESDGQAGQTATCTFLSQSTAAAEVGVGDRVLVVTGPAFTAGLYFAVEGISRHGGMGRIAAFTRLRLRQVLESYVPELQ